MHLKFLARCTGSARAAAEYLLGARDAAGQPREGVEVLRGDPHRVAAHTFQRVERQFFLGSDYDGAFTDLRQPKPV